MNEAGLPEKWRSRFRKGNGRCTGKEEKNKPQSRRHPSANHRITLQNLSGSFVVFLVGISFSIAVFIIELILRRRNNNSRVVHIQPVPAARPVAKKSTPPSVGQSTQARAARRRINNPKVGKIQPLLIRPVIRPAVVNNLPQLKDTQQVPVVNNQPAAAPVTAPSVGIVSSRIEAAINIVKDLPAPKEVITVIPTSSIIATAAVVNNPPVEAANKGQTVVVIHPPAV